MLMFKNAAIANKILKTINFTTIAKVWLISILKYYNELFITYFSLKQEIL